MSDRPRIIVRQTTPEDFGAIEALSRDVYPNEPPWTATYLASHHRTFPEGQLVAVDEGTQEVVGMAASLIVSWEDYDRFDAYGDMTGGGEFTNHDPAGRTLYGAEVMVSPHRRRQGIGAKLYAARRELAEGHGLLRIRAGARLPGYHRHAHEMSAEDYVVEVIHRRIHDTTLTFQLDQGFHVLAVVPDYMRLDRESRGYAALIEWINRAVATPEDTARRNPRFRGPDES